MEKKRISLLKRLMLITNIIVIIFLFFSYAASFVNPQHFWWLALFGLGYGIMLSVNTLFVIFWLIMRSRYYLLSLIVILSGIGKVFNIYEVHFFSHEPVHVENSFPVKVMSFNVRLFDLYNWMHNAESRKNIFKFLSKESPDIVSFQEYYTSDRTETDFNNNDTLKRILPALYSNVEYTSTFRNLDHWGIATFSKFPIINKKAVHFATEGGNIFIYSDIVIGTDTIRVFNTHLESIRFKAQDYKFIENLGSDVEQDDMKGGLGILSRLKSAFIKRSKQVDMLHQYISESPYPVILCGDFNDTPSSYTYSTISKGLKDAFRESGSGFGKSYAGIFPSFRIDYILHSDKFISSGYRTIHENLSDHYPISCWIDKQN